MNKKILYGPGIRVELDPSQYYSDDPGLGTPAIVCNDKYAATFNCALDTRELDCGDYMLTDKEYKWLLSVSDEVNNWLYLLHAR